MGTLMLPQAWWQTGTTRIRMQTDRFTGKQVIHCNFLHHTDQGMMNFLSIAGTEDVLYECAKSFDAMCYDGFFADRPRTPHPENPSCFVGGPGGPDDRACVMHAWFGLVL